MRGWFRNREEENFSGKGVNGTPEMPDGSAHEANGSEAFDGAEPTDTGERDPQTAEDRDALIAALEEDLDRERIHAARLELTAKVTERGLPSVFAELVDFSGGGEEIGRRVDALEEAFRRAVEEAVNRRLSGMHTPRRSNTGARMRREDIFRIRDAGKRQSAIRDNIELFRKG